MTTTYLRRLARFLVQLDYATLPPEVLDAARCQVLDMFAAAAHRTPEADAAARAYGAVTSGGRARVLATGRRLDPAAAAAVNAAFSMAHDFDDIVWMGHTCHSAVFAALAVAEHEGASSAAFVTAVVAANEAAGRLGASVELGPVNGQMVTHIHAFGAAAAAAKLLGLDEDQTMHALSISIAQPNYALQPAFLASSAKLLSASVPLAAGIHAAYGAREGLTGHPALLEDERGFWKNLSFVPLPQFFDDLGTFWVMTTLAIKDTPGCHYFQTACTALSRALAGARAPIARIEVAAHKLAVEVDRFGAVYRKGATATVNINFDLGATLAIVAIAGELTPAQLDEGWLAAHRAELDRVRASISIAHDPALTLAVLRSAGAVESGRAALASIKPAMWISLVRKYREMYRGSLVSARELVAWGRALAAPAAAPAPGLAFPARVTVVFADGTSRTEQVDTPLGTFGSPGMPAVLRAKLAGAGLAHLFDAGMALGAAPLADFVGAVDRSRAA